MPPHTWTNGFSWTTSSTSSWNGPSFISTFKLTKIVLGRCLSYCNYIINHLPTKLLSWKSPFEKVCNKKLVYNFMRTFGCACWPNLRPYNHHKFNFRSKTCIFIGYSLCHHGYKCLDLATGNVFVSRHVLNETLFPYTNTKSPQEELTDTSISLPTNLRAHHCFPHMSCRFSPWSTYSTWSWDNFTRKSEHIKQIWSVLSRDGCHYFIYCSWQHLNLSTFNSSSHAFTFQDEFLETKTSGWWFYSVSSTENPCGHCKVTFIRAFMLFWGIQIFRMETGNEWRIWCFDSKSYMDSCSTETWS